MKNMLYIMKNQESKTELRLLPNYFKKIGLVIMLLAFAGLVLVDLLHLQPASSEVIKNITKNCFTLGLLFMAWARDKTEDEMTRAIRLKTMSNTLFFAATYVILNPLFERLFGATPTVITGDGLVFMMLGFYLLTYFYEKRDR